MTGYELTLAVTALADLLASKLTEKKMIKKMTKTNIKINRKAFKLSGLCVAETFDLNICNIIVRKLRGSV